MLKENKDKIEVIRSNARANMREQMEGNFVSTEICSIPHCDIANICDAILDLAQNPDNIEKHE